MFIEPKDASTLVVMRANSQNASHDLEVLMLLRSAESSFVPLSYVFPGGGMDDDDRDADLMGRCAGFDRDETASVADKIGDDLRARALWITSIRESFEETGLLYAYSGRGKLYSQDDDREKLAYYRNAINSGRFSFIKMVMDEKMVLATDRLRFFSHWVTPFFSSIRYSAYFFATIAPDCQEVEHDGEEIIDHTWITPNNALKKNRQGSFRMVFPTISTLEKMKGFALPEDALDNLYY
ncbi:MAG TPA: hypothetical protein PK926_08115 [Spirochaetota bacterium]|nr:hypothetical protein [Spirochaetota bacterium]HPI88526.1 hypothetical protein [Spirochaetota bacterium]HPR48006.1 hypothetical protein [Spirochaetota bacterium]